MLAYHWGRAGELQKDVEYLERAGERALAVYANKDASQIFRTILKKTEQAAHSAEPANAWAKQGQGKSARTGRDPSRGPDSSGLSLAAHSFQFHVILRTDTEHSL